MQPNKIHILSTVPVGEALVNEAAQNDIVIDEVSFIKIDEIVNTEIEKRIGELAHQNIIAVFTSKNAVNVVGKFISAKPSWKIFCIGNATKNAVGKVFGEGNVIGTAHYGSQLAEKIIEHSSVKKVVFFCGDQRRDELPGKLKKNGIEIEEIVVYKTIETSRALSKQYDGILFFSPSAVQSFFSKNSINQQAQIFVIGTTTANAVKSFIQQPVIIAETPGKENLVHLAIKHFSKSKIL
jgi:uroporphyrinogen-III synthase